jgi:hypothetical protein
MSYRVQLMSSDDIEKMTDDQLFQEMKRFRKIIYRMRKNGEGTRKAEEEMCYLQVEAQRRGHSV